MYKTKIIKIEQLIVMLFKILGVYKLMSMTVHVLVLLYVSCELQLLPPLRYKGGVR